MKHYVTLNYKESDNVFDFYSDSLFFKIIPDMYLVLKKDNIDLEFTIVSINNTLIKGMVYNFSEIFEVQDKYTKKVLLDVHSITLMFDSEEEALYFKLKYGGEINE